MSEVKRYFWNADNLDGFGYGSMDSLADASSQELVCASDYDAALAREAALREERDALQQRLTETEKLLREVSEELWQEDDSGDIFERIDAALKPVEVAVSVEPSFQELHGLTDTEYADFREWQKGKRAQRNAG